MLGKYSIPKLLCILAIEVLKGVINFFFLFFYLEDSRE